MEYLSSFHESVVSTCGEKMAFAAYGVGALLTLKFISKVKTRSRAVKINGATCVISGASQGIGASVGELLAANGAKKVILVARTQSKLDAVADKINKRYPNTAVSFPVDCSDYSQVEKLAQSVKEQFGTPSILVNCAGAGRWKYLWEMDAEEVVACMNAPYFAAALMSKAFVCDMIKENYGTIVNVQSPAGHISWGGSTAYMATRWALRGLVEALRADLYPTKVLVQEVVLGETKSEYFNNNPDSIDRIPTIGKLAPAMSSERAAQGVINSIRSGADTYSYPHMLGIMMVFNKWFPSLIRYMSIKTGCQQMPKKSQ